MQAIGAKCQLKFKPARCIPESLAMCLWTHRKGEVAGFGKIMCGKIMRNFYDFARHDFAAVFIRYRQRQLKRFPESRQCSGLGAGQKSNRK